MGPPQPEANDVDESIVVPLPLPKPRAKKRRRRGNNASASDALQLVAHTLGYQQGTLQQNLVGLAPEPEPEPIPIQDAQAAGGQG